MSPPASHDGFPVCLTFRAAKSPPVWNDQPLLNILFTQASNIRLQMLQLFILFLFLVIIRYQHDRGHEMMAKKKTKQLFLPTICSNNHFYKKKALPSKV